jgi:hypothetical protein
MYYKDNTIISCEIKNSDKLMDYVKNVWAFDYKFYYNLLIDKILIKLINKQELILIENVNKNTTVKLKFNIEDVIINDVHTNYILNCEIKNKVVHDDDFWSLVYKDLI